MPPGFHAAYPCAKLEIAVLAPQVMLAQLRGQVTAAQKSHLSISLGLSCQASNPRISGNGKYLPPVIANDGYYRVLLVPQAFHLRYQCPRQVVHPPDRTIICNQSALHEISQKLQAVDWQVQ